MDKPTIYTFQVRVEVWDNSFDNAVALISGESGDIGTVMVGVGPGFINGYSDLGAMILDQVVKEHFAQ